MIPEPGSRLARGLMMGAAAVAGVMLLDGLVHVVLAQTPFGAPKRAPEPGAGGIVGWILAKQSEFYREMSATIRAARSDGSAVWTLLAISFAYGIFHAAGPGHGKAVISSYLVANQETARRGIVLSFASALMQSLVAVLIVGICAWLLNATAKTMCSAERAIEIAKYSTNQIIFYQQQFFLLYQFIPQVFHFFIHFSNGGFTNFFPCFSAYHPRRMLNMIL